MGRRTVHPDKTSIALSFRVIQYEVFPQQKALGPQERPLCRGCYLSATSGAAGALTSRIASHSDGSISAKDSSAGCAVTVPTASASMAANSETPLMARCTALFASLMLVVGVPCGAQSPASNAPASNAPASSAPAESAASSASSSSSSSSATAPSSAAAPAAADSAPPATGSKLASSAADASAEPSPEVLKEARREGFTPKKRSGVTQYCSSDATLGTRFVTEKCYNEQDMEREVHRRQDQRNLLHQQAGCGGANCSGH
jgi:hypothetical protein